MLELKQVNKYFHKGKKNEIHVINQTSISLENNGLVALLGPSGCGKTTLLNVIGGLDKVNRGQIFVNGQKISTRNIHKTDKIRNLNIGYIFQDYKLIDNESVFDNVAIVLKMLGLKDKQEIKKRVEYVLECVGMLRYQKRPAGMLSGGERQRVGIARAIVKNPNIILADEPTGNLDSKNTLEIMKIIKAISKDRLVILVTHEQELAKFYASRIIEIADGQILKNYENNHNHELDYEVDNCFYLKDFKEKENFQKKNIDIQLYQNEQENISIEMVIKNGNIYIKSNTPQKVEVVDENSSIEFIDDHYTALARSKLEEYQFDFSKIDTNTFKKRYRCIMNPFNSLKKGFKKVFAYPILKKILLAGFFLAGMFIMYSVSSIAATLKIHEEDFLTIDPHYLILEKSNISKEEYLSYENSLDIDYILPGNSIISFQVPYDDYYQTAQRGVGSLNGSLMDITTITPKDLTQGRMPENDQEILADEMVIKKMLKERESFQMAGIIEVKDLLNRTVTINNLKEFQIVGIVSTQSPSIYVAKNKMLPIVLNSTENTNDYYTSSENNPNEGKLIDYTLYQDQINLTKGRLPQNDNEIIVNSNNAETMPLNKEIGKSNEPKYLVVGYYTSRDGYNSYFTTERTVLYNTLRTTKSIAIFPKDKNKVLKTYQDQKLNIYNSYDRSKELYLKDKQESIKSTLLVSGIILVISFIEIFLMIRSSFLSRIKEIGIYRAIGVKKLDIYQMFAGEIIAITTLAGIPGLILMAYILYVLSGISLLSKFIIISPVIVILSVTLVYLFNLLIGLLPVYHTIRKRPAEILSRHDLD